MKSADGAEKYERDVKNGKLSQFLLKCLLFTCVEMQNHMRTFTGSDGRFYRNELCLDDTNGDTVATNDLKALKMDDREKTIYQQWLTILSCAKDSSGYNQTLTYGVYQIYAELDTRHKDGSSKKTIWENPPLHAALADIKPLMKEYFNTEIVPVLFEYEFLK